LVKGGLHTAFDQHVNRSGKNVMPKSPSAAGRAEIVIKDQRDFRVLMWKSA
jgi:hypothetical protein